VASRHVEDRRRHDVGLDLLRPGARSHLLRLGESGTWNPEVRPGDNKWTATIFARKPETGEAVWAYQLTPHDLHDYDGVNEQILVDLSINGAARKVLLRPESNGYVYVIDRA
jgi:glucose dehydrogenase